jgi:predicted Zn-dependent protease
VPRPRTAPIWSRLAAMAACIGILAAGAPAPAAAAEGRMLPLLSDADEARMGAEAHEQILAEFGGAYDDPELAAYVTSIGKFLALTSERPNVDFTFTVLNSPIVNAFANPGGYVYVTRGLLALAGDEAELAGVIAHEIGHVAARHHEERMGNSLLANLGLTLLGALTKSQQIAGIAQFGALALLQSYSREQEYEADLLGVRYMSRAGFDPEAMAAFLSKLKAYSEFEALEAGQPGANDQLSLLATHPRTADRVRRAIQAAGLRKVQDPIVGRDIYLNKIDGILYGDDPDQGLVRGRQFIHPALRFAFEAPPDFALLNGESQVSGRGPDGALLVFDGAQRTDPSMQAYVRDTWLAQVNIQGLEPLRIDRRDAATAAFRIDIQGQTYDARAVAIAFDSRTIFRFLFLTPPAVTARYDEAFRRTAYSFRTISAAEAAAVTPRRIALHRVAAGETPAQVARRMALDGHKLERFLVLNGLQQAQPLSAGALVKIVVE